MTKPQRVRLSRKAGWRMPNRTTNVARPTIFGNPFPVSTYGHEGAVDLYRRWIDGTLPDDPSLARSDRFSAWHSTFYLSLPDLRAKVLERVPELRGHDLACWCRADQPCHADALLAIVNEKAPA